PPDGGAGAKVLGGGPGPNPVAMPGAGGPAVEAAGQAPLEEGEVPGAILGEGLQGLPVADSAQADQRLGDGVFLDVEGQAGDPLDEALLAAAREADGDRQQDGLPEQPQLGSLHRTPPEGGLSADTTDKLPAGGGPVNELE